MGTRKQLFTIGKWLLFIALFSFILLLPAIFPHGKNITLYLQAIGVAASAIAIWGDQIKARFFGPKLVLTLFKQEGELTFDVSRTDQPVPVRYYHFNVENSRKGLVAKNVQVILSSIDSPYMGGKNKLTSLGGRLPFPWSFRQPIKGIEENKYYSNIGADDLCDLACLVNDEGEKLRILATPWQIIANQLNIGPNQKAVIEAVAIADNAQSNQIKLEIFWDGQWPKDDADAPKHVVIKKV